MSRKCTTFTDRSRIATNALAYTGLELEATPAMLKADQKINQKLTQLDQLVSDPTDTELAEAGAKWAKSKDRSGSGVLEVLTQPSASQYATRYATLRAGAQAALVQDVEKQHRGWTTTSLVQSMRSAVTQRLEDMAAQATKVLQELSPAGQRYMSNSYASAVYLAKTLVNVTTTPVDEIAQLRAATEAWDSLEADTVQVGDKTVGRHYAMEALYQAMAGNPVQDPATMNPDKGAPFMDSLPHYGLLWLDPAGCAALFLVRDMSQVVFHGLGTMSPLVDPLGEDSEQLQARLEAYRSAQEWLADKLADHSPRLFARNPEHAFEYAGNGMDRFGKAGFQSALLAAGEFLKSHNAVSN